MGRPRAADDFATIRARMEELRRERSPAPSGRDDARPVGPRLRDESANLGLARREPMGGGGRQERGGSWIEPSRR